MGWFDKFKALFNFEINEPIIKINVIKNSNNKTNDNEYLYDKENKRLYIN